MRNNKKLVLFFLILIISVSVFADGFCEKYRSLPKIFEIQLKHSDRLENKSQAYIYKDHIVSSNKTVNDAINRIVDDFDKELSSKLSDSPSKKPKLYNRLDIDINYFRTGESYLSNLIIARFTKGRKQTDVSFKTATYNLKDGSTVTLKDLFGDNEKAYEFISKRASEHLNSVFADDERNSEEIDRATSIDGIKEADFTLSGVELTLHFNAKSFFKNRVGILHVRFYYPELREMMTDIGLKASDNSKWKMIALTFDDGPRGMNTSRFITAVRKQGMRVTFFTVGKLYDENKALLHREYDANHLIANHSWNHWNGHGLKPNARLKQVNKVQDYLKKELGETSLFFRAPVGTYPPWISAEIGLPIIQWSLDTYDFKGRPANETFSKIKKYAKEGDIVLMHDTGNITHTAVPLFGKWLWDNGFMPVTVEELAWEHGVRPEPNKVYFRFFKGKSDERKDSNTN